MQDQAIAADFSQRYEFLIADTPALREQVFALRHRVFCDEFGYDMDHSQGLESDSFDDHSIHVLLRRKYTDEPVGCFRIVKSQLSFSEWLPFEHYGVPHVRPGFDWSAVDRINSVEISRLALDASTRAGRGDNGEKLPSDAYLVVAMFFAIVSILENYGCDHIFMVIEPRLGRLTARYGMSLDQISPAFEYYGQRATFMSTATRMLSEIPHYKPAFSKLFEVVRTQLLIENSQSETG